MPFNEAHLAEINALRGLDLTQLLTSPNPPQILRDFVNALGCGDLVPTRPANGLFLSPRDLELIRSFSDLSEGAIASLTRIGAVPSEIERTMCQRFVEAWVAIDGPLEFRSVYRYTALRYTPVGLAICNREYRIVALLAASNADFGTVCYRRVPDGGWLPYQSAIEVADSDHDMRVLLRGVRRDRRFIDLIAKAIVIDKIACRGREFDAVVDIHPDAQFNRQAVRQNLMYTAEVRAHFHLLFPLRMLLRGYSRMVIPEYFATLIKALTYPPRGQMGDLVTYRLSAALQMVREQAAVAEAPRHSPSPEPRVPTLLARTALTMRRDRAIAELSDVPEPVAPSLAVDTPRSHRI